MELNHSKSHDIFIFTVKIQLNLAVQLKKIMLVASFRGLYCSITHLHVYQCQPASLMNPYPGVDHLAASTIFPGMVLCTRRIGLGVGRFGFIS